MSHIKLETALNRFSEWCAHNHVQYDIVVDESDMQGIIVFKKDKSLLNNLFDYMKPVLESEGVYYQQDIVRGGAVVALSLLALSENKFNRVISAAGETIEEQSFEDRLNEIFCVSLNKSYTPISETQYKSATKGTSRSNQTGLQRELLTTNATYSGFTDILGKDSHSQKDDDSSDDDSIEEQAEFVAVSAIDFEQVASNDEMSGLSSCDGDLPQPLDDCDSDSFDPKSDHAGEFADGNSSDPGMPVTGECDRDVEATVVIAAEDYNLMIDKVIDETLSGMATPTDHEPGELFKRFSMALDTLGEQLGIGSVKDALAKQGIKWKETDDHLGIMLFIMNAATKAPQPIARISAETLDKPHDFGDQLLSVLDYANGDAPGTIKQKQEELRNMQKVTTDVANSLHPEQPEEQNQPVAQPMQQPMPAQQPQPQPTQQAQPQKPVQTGQAQQPTGGARI